MHPEIQKPGLDRLIRYPELQQRLGRSKKSIQRHSAVGQLPRLVRDGNIVGMLESEVEAHFQRLREPLAR